MLSKMEIGRIFVGQRTEDTRKIEHYQLLGLGRLLVNGEIVVTDIPLIDNAWCYSYAWELSNWMVDGLIIEDGWRYVNGAKFRTSPLPEERKQLLVSTIKSKERYLLTA